MTRAAPNGRNAKDAGVLLRRPKNTCGVILVATSHHDLQDIPEERGDAGEQSKGRGHVLVSPVVMNNGRGIVEDVTANQCDHGKAEKEAEVKAPRQAADNERERKHAADEENRL